ncbi:MAG: peptide chain release factor N(5)-glutamine methyltransferase [Candidatus Omnitrophica bacterium]|nr:peptide chain release factor N(5)-glutamine methyltransferase [Candidatus Omnitrophota bacterium]
MERRVELPCTRTVQGLLKSGSDYLAQEGITNPLGESEIFLSHTLNCFRTELYLENLAVEQANMKHFWRLLNARASGFPLQYLLGSTEFMGLPFKMSPGVFIPRPETEILVETVLNPSPITHHPSPKILDIGTGCGNIAISLAKYLRSRHIFACDICDSALQLAKENSFLNKVEISLVKSNLFSAFKKENYFSLIISNPPYISAQDIPELPRELAYEPRLAYEGGRDGLLFYRRIINEAADYLQDGGRLCLEIGDNQRPLVQEILMQSAGFRQVSVVRDYNDIERVIVAQKIGHR